MSGQQASTPRACAPLRHDLSVAITPLNSARNPERTEAIREVVDAFRNLRASVARFVLMLEDIRGNARSLESTTAQSLGDLLSALEDHARALDFGRLEDLTFAIETARSAEQQRDLVFQASPGSGTAGLQQVARGLERLDATFVGLCVEHVLERHYRGRAGSGVSA
ncbi:hypothetical protein AWB69_00952 [Caballeronia udeis]|uniref:Uncharacterized protein n=2 Tax=Caballeronia udeis TaxID=1232866 RepID=A0A158FCL9_9BURK|nr:hypothetical protein AWB69_00952 [Caballeronia udeis]